ncbi:uncharacterized protein LOC114523222 [Dendronephthya gigantea]|uniref:uncharacterized protein LOC114523222 n=1 Tax=Dendronephthya gigantea TaxID=151771 RepID=UPI001068F5A2|nr:uncharacterized protein LOC114523222 [Dendronephthya gigantea]
MAERSDCLVLFGWFAAFAMYIVQACFFMKFLEEHTTTNGNLYWIGIVIYLLFALAVFMVLRKKGYAEPDEEKDEIWCVWGFWFIYIVLYTISVGLIFFQVARKLDKSETYGPNFLKAMLSIAPALLVLVLQLAISPSYRKGVLKLSIFAALDLFDGIEMLEIVLMQNEIKDFELDSSVEKVMISFACASFIVTSLDVMVRYKFKDDTVEERTNTMAVCFGYIEILLTNAVFLGLRIYVWADCGYEASIFIAKNTMSLVVGIVDLGIACKCCTCG